jgi:hypothetical protein
MRDGETMNDAKPDAAEATDAVGTPAEKPVAVKPVAAKPGSTAPGTSKAAPESTDEPARSTADTVRSVRSGVASAVWLLAVVAALILAAGALVIALDFNPRNGVVSFLTDTADRLNLLGELKTFEGGRSADSKQSALVKTVLVNWGIAALAYLVVGKVLDRLIRP